MGKVKKLLLSLLSFLILFTSSLSYFSVPKIYAADTNPWYFQSYPQWYTKVYDEQTSPPQEIFGERYTAAQVQWVIYSLISIIVYPAKETVSCIFKGGGVNNCVSQNPLISFDTRTIPRENKGVLATLFDSNRPFSGVNYFRSKLASIHFIPQAEAQVGVGFNALNPVQHIWRACRDIMYGFFVIIIILFAFMIMFRVKLNPQTVVSVQSAIPKIIVTLILVTFSYAIAGFMVDLMYVVMGLVALIFTSFGLISGGSWSQVFKLITVGPGSTFSAGGILGWMMGYWWPFVVAFFSSCLSFILGPASLGQIALGALGMIIGIFLAIGVFLWLIVTTVKIFVLLIKTYLMVLISVIFSPFIIGFGAILPAGGFGIWIKGLVTNLMIYPLTGALLLVSVLFLSGTYQGVRNTMENWLELDRGSLTDIFAPSSNPQYWYPPLTLGTQTSSWDPLPMLWTFASLGILAMIPKAADIMKGLMSGKGVEGGMAGIGTALGAMGGYALGTSKYIGGGILDSQLVKYGQGTAGSRTIEGWVGSQKRGPVGWGQRFVGRQLANLGERRGIRFSPSQSTGWYRRGSRPAPPPDIQK